MTYVRANRGRTGQPDLRIHVRTVHVHQAAVFVDDRADFLDVVLEYSMSRRVGDHQTRQVIAMLRGLLPQIGDIHVAIRRRGDHDDPHAGHGGARRIRPMRRRGDEHDVTM